MLTLGGVNGRGKEDKTMSYDYSITKRKGCNYCLRGKSICTNAKILVEINDDDCNGNAGLVIRPHAEFRFDTETIKINYCPICGKKLMGQ